MNTPIEDPAFNTRPEWLRIDGVRHYFGLAKTYVYELQSAGLITSRVLRKRGARKGVRLYSYDSIAKYIETNAGEEAPQIQD